MMFLNVFILRAWVIGYSFERKREKRERRETERDRERHSAKTRGVAFLSHSSLVSQYNQANALDLILQKISSTTKWDWVA